MMMTPAATCSNLNSQKAPSCHVIMSKCPSLKGEHARHEIEKQQMRVGGWGASEFLTKCPPTSHTAVELCQERGRVGGSQQTTLIGIHPRAQRTQEPVTGIAHSFSHYSLGERILHGSPPQRTTVGAFQGTHGPLDDSDIAFPSVRLGNAVCGIWDLLHPRTGSERVLHPLVRPLCPCTQSSRVNTHQETLLCCVLTPCLRSSILLRL